MARFIVIAIMLAAALASAPCAAEACGGQYMIDGNREAWQRCLERNDERERPPPKTVCHSREVAGGYETVCEQRQ
jgi:hypothetical protein